MLKDIMVCLEPGASYDVACDFARSTATTFGAHLAGLAFAYEPVVPDTMLVGLPPDVFDKPRAENRKLAELAASRFEDVARGASLSFSSHVVGASFGEAVNLAATVARRFDLSVIRQEGPEDYGRQSQLIESILFGSGRPLIVVPYIEKAGLKLDRVMVCWDHGQHSARAIGDALPMLKRAKKVEVVTVASREADIRDVPGADIGKHLARHGINVTLENIVAPEIDVADAFLSHAADASIDFMVMGGYGHSRLREFVLGGVTRKILASMTVPTLLAH